MGIETACVCHEKAGAGTEQSLSRLAVISDFILSVSARSGGSVTALSGADTRDIKEFGGVLASISSIFAKASFKSMARGV